MTPRRPARPRRRSAAEPGGRQTLRVVAGEAGGRRLDAPGGAATRPTSDRVREAVFNALESLGAVDGARVLDAFAGSGALGVEALSRGAAHVTFVDRSSAARRVVEANLAACGFTDRAVVVDGDGGRMASAGGPWDLVLFDPPYAFDGWSALLTSVADGLPEGAVVVVESDREVPLPAPLHAVRVKRYGSTVVTFATRTGATT